MKRIYNNIYFRRERKINDTLSRSEFNKYSKDLLELCKRMVNMDRKQRINAVYFYYNKYRLIY